MKTTQYKTIKKLWSAITLGCWQLAKSLAWGDRSSSQNTDTVVKKALDCGITAFDTAEFYGNGESERRLAKALGSQKDDVIIISKIWPDTQFSLENYQKHLDNTLLALQRDTIDVYLVHWPHESFNSPEKSKKLAEIMQSLKETGKITLIGLSNFLAYDLELLGDALAPFDINQIPYSLLEHQAEGKVKNICQNHGLAFMAYNVIAKGLLAKPLTSEDHTLPARKNRLKAIFNDTIYPHALRVFEAVNAIAQELDRKPIEVSIAWALQQDNILTTIIGSSKSHQIPDIAAAATLTLTQDHLNRLQTASNTFKVTLEKDTPVSENRQNVYRF